MPNRALVKEVFNFVCTLPDDKFQMLWRVGPFQRLGRPTGPHGSLHTPQQTWYNPHLRCAQAGGAGCETGQPSQATSWATPEMSNTPFTMCVRTNREAEGGTQLLGTRLSSLWPHE